MNQTKTNTGHSFKVCALILCVGALPLVCGLTGCFTGTRDKQSTGEYIDDHTLSSHVKKALGEDQLYKYGDVNVVTFKGVVQLNGFVSTKDQLNRAGELAKKAEGVKEVQNNITVKE
ncbi:MAG: BON domain-containing protein [Verrucomicrobiota bacterium]